MNWGEQNDSGSIRAHMLAKLITPLTLPAGCAARVWQVQIQPSAALLQESRAQLSAEEYMRATRFHHEADRGRFVITRAALRLLLAKALHTSPSALAITYNAFGKPQLANEHALEFSVSHSGDLALVALADGARVGVDIEEWGRWGADTSINDALNQIASAEEREAFSVLPDAQRLPGFFRLWTLKESLLKAQGAGFQRDPRGLNVVLPGLSPMRSDIESLDWADRSDGSRWRLYELNAPSAYSAALAIEQGAAQYESPS